ncbi:hypothetical protein [Haladaptatus paucihalophilus]|uniref:hypothetical protein n=1 Tax=Haladaptatus paucihalophilus TaxID=367189 RepID=UPI001E42A160|nr:hypothetical protein [Haladaptatus paucihalophilus]
MRVRNRFGSRIARVPVSYYDFVLFAVPLVLLAGLVAAATLPIPLHVGITVSGIVSVVVLADAMFVRPPSNRPPNGRSA